MPAIFPPVRVSIEETAGGHWWAALLDPARHRGDENAPSLAQRDGAFSSFGYLCDQED